MIRNVVLVEHNRLRGLLGRHAERVARVQFELAG